MSNNIDFEKMIISYAHSTPMTSIAVDFTAAAWAAEFVKGVIEGEIIQESSIPALLGQIVGFFLRIFVVISLFILYYFSWIYCRFNQCVLRN